MTHEAKVHSMLGYFFNVGTNSNTNTHTSNIFTFWVWVRAPVSGEAMMHHPRCSDNTLQERSMLSYEDFLTKNTILYLAPQFFMCKTLS